VKRDTESPASPERLMEAICRPGNLRKAFKQVQDNKGSPRIDGMTVGQLPGYLVQEWPALRDQLLSGTYLPQPVKRVEIRKPDGGMRKLGIPTVVDRFLQQAVVQVSREQWDPTFSEHGYGFGLIEPPCTDPYARWCDRDSPRGLTCVDCRVPALHKPAGSLTPASCLYYNSQERVTRCTPATAAACG
jgi:hypothetical protein